MGTAEWFWPSWSPDGREILAAGREDTVGASWDVYLMSADGSRRRALGASPASEIHPSWSPDGKFVVFDSDRQSTTHVFVVGRDGSGLRRLTTDWSADGAAVPSPDGRHIAFGSSRSGPHLVYVIATDGTDERRLVDRATAIYDPQWSPDGSKIAFMTEGPNSDLYQVAPDGSALVPLAAIPASEFGARWSPNGTRVLYIRQDSVGSHLVIAESNGDHPTQLTRLAGTVGWPSWCPDNEHAVFTVKNDGNEDVYAVRVNDRRVRRLTDHPARDTAPSCDAAGRVVFASERSARRHLFVVEIRDD